MNIYYLFQFTKDILMGIGQEGNPFTERDILNKELILQMLQYEDEIYFSDIGQKNDVRIW
jgi:hypothetical protein